MPLLLPAHPLLSDEELAELLGLERKSVRSLLYTLHTLGCPEPISTSAGNRWCLRERELRLLTSANHLSLRNLVVRCDEEAHPSPMVQPGVRWLLAHIQHTAGIYSFFATLAQAARQRPGQCLCWWETGAPCERRYRVGEHWHNLRPDILAEYRAESQQFRFWLEWDRGTMNVRDLAIKSSSYAHFLDSREWAREGARLPRLLVVAPEVAQERRIQRMAQAKLVPTTRLVIWTTTAGLLREQGPLAPIWFACLPQLYHGAHAGPHRRCFMEMNLLKNDHP